ncbi:glutathione S-transferase family protein [Thalassococcus sp. S3]|uniref:glutathione S-transferase family protein n=1 Tax=Thalassococcus sp. S3 TaxID=2017482 RepID=UPI001024780C|nr:glutathione S-transferase family protein [Thalassococcus sp. S3]QBF33801.1 glutathione S-transferase [Thalassococcus sp. S3]
MYKVYGKVQSRAFRVLWALEELGQPYELIDAGAQSAEVLAVNPIGKIPVLTDGDATLTDSAAIMSYLADKHGALTHPAGTTARAKQDALIHMVNEELDANLWLAMKHAMVLPEDRRVTAILPSAASDIERGLARIASRLEGPFLQGETMTIADILCTHCLNWTHAMKYPIEHENLKTYAKAMRNREAFKRASAA